MSGSTARSGTQTKAASGSARTSPTIPVGSDLERIVDEIFQAQLQNQYAVGSTSAKERKRKLNRLKDAVRSHKQEIRRALHADLRKPQSEVDMAETYAVVRDVKHTVKHLSRWMRPHRASTPMALLGSRSHIHYEPKGVALIISPWNFPISLTFGPLVSAIASGNCVMIKPSEHSPHASAVIKKIIESLFEQNEVAVIEGSVEASTALLKRPFNHIFFTGAPSIGKIVMEAASKHLASVTLELGGKSPTIVDETANLDAAARRIATAKYMNNGQICIAPDYLFVHESKKDQFLDKLREQIASMYGADIQESDSYGRMVDDRHFERVAGYLADATSKGAQVVFGGRTESGEAYIEPTVLTEVDMQSDLMTNEIFGPVLPVYGYAEIEEPIRVINSKERPLALYIFSKSEKNIAKIIQSTRAGGTCVNQCTMHFLNNNLPFGGVNNSGIGRSNGFFGFEAFSNARGVYTQVAPFSAVELVSAPYTKLKQTLIDLSINYL